MKKPRMPAFLIIAGAALILIIVVLPFLANRYARYWLQNELDTHLASEFSVSFAEFTFNLWKQTAHLKGLQIAHQDSNGLQWRFELDAFSPDNFAFVNRNGHKQRELGKNDVNAPRFESFTHRPIITLFGSANRPDSLSEQPKLNFIF